MYSIFKSLCSEDEIGPAMPPAKRSIGPSGTVINLGTFRTGNISKDHDVKTEIQNYLIG